MQLNRYTIWFDLLVQHLYKYRDWFICALNLFIFNRHDLSESSCREYVEFSAMFLQIDKLNIVH